jgi:hypothetical protein
MSNQSETPEQAAALDAIETKIDALTPEQRMALEQYLQEHETPPNSAAEAVALIPVIEKAIAQVAPKTAVAPARHPEQTVGASLPLQPLAR